LPVNAVAIPPPSLHFVAAVIASVMFKSRMRNDITIAMKIPPRQPDKRACQVEILRKMTSVVSCSLFSFLQVLERGSSQVPSYLSASDAYLDVLDFVLFKAGWEYNVTDCKYYLRSSLRFSVLVESHENATDSNAWILSEGKGRGPHPLGV